MKLQTDRKEREKESAGRLIVLSGPSGVGKDSILDLALSRCPKLKKSVSATTRLPRVNEVDGVDYHFISLERFEAFIQEEGMLEYAQYSGHYYGVPARFVQETLSKGFHVILKIDVVGAIHVMECFPDVVSVFIQPPSFEELERRLRSRCTDSEEDIVKRLEVARFEISNAYRYQHEIINDDLETATQAFLAIVDHLA